MYTFTFLAQTQNSSWLGGLALLPRGLTGSQHLQNYALIFGTFTPQGMKTQAIDSQNSHFDMLSRGLFLREFAIWRRGVSYILEGRGREKSSRQTSVLQYFCYQGEWLLEQHKGTNYE